MNCNSEIHDELKNTEESTCPFCNQQLIEVEVKSLATCDKMEIINDEGRQVCKNCGLVNGYDQVKEYFNFHENIYRIRRKSIYHRKYHVENVIYKAGIKISRDKKDKICKVFDEMEKIVPLIDNNRKRMISINFIIKQLFLCYMPGIPYEHIKITKSDKTLKYYKDYWKSIDDEIGEKIKKIIQ